MKFILNILVVSLFMVIPLKINAGGVYGIKLKQNSEFIVIIVLIFLLLILVFFILKNKSKK